MNKILQSQILNTAQKRIERLENYTDICCGGSKKGKCLKYEYHRKVINWDNKIKWTIDRSSLECIPTKRRSLRDEEGIDHSWFKYDFKYVKKYNKVCATNLGIGKKWGILLSKQQLINWCNLNNIKTKSSLKYCDIVKLLINGLDEEVIEKVSNNHELKPNKENDILVGKKYEKKIFDEYLTQFHSGDEKIYFHPNKYNAFDFFVKKDGKIIHEYELKTRFDIKFGRYDSLFFNESKLKYADKKLKKHPTRKFTFLWYLEIEDVLYYWDYHGNQEKEFYRKKGINRKSGDKPKDCIYVYNKHIQDVEVQEYEIEILGHDGLNIKKK